VAGLPGAKVHLKREQELANGCAVWSGVSEEVPREGSSGHCWEWRRGSARVRRWGWVSSSRRGEGTRAMAPPGPNSTSGCSCKVVSIASDGSVTGHMRR